MRRQVYTNSISWQQGLPLQEKSSKTRLAAQKLGPCFKSQIVWVVPALEKEMNPVLQCAGATIAASPVLVCNILAPEASQSFAALLVGFALSEMWRAPAAIMIRDVSPPNLGSTGSAVHLCVRNLLGGLGPLSERPQTPSWHCRHYFFLLK